MSLKIIKEIKKHVKNIKIRFYYALSSEDKDLMKNEGLEEHLAGDRYCQIKI